MPIYLDEEGAEQARRALAERLALEVYRLQEENADLKARVEALQKENTCLSLMNHDWIGRVEIG